MTDKDIHDALHALSEPSSPEFFDQLEARLETEGIPQRSPRGGASIHRFIPRGIAAAALVAFIGVEATGHGPIGNVASPSSPPPSVVQVQPVLASEVIEKAVNAFASTKSLSADYEYYANLDIYETEGLPYNGPNQYTGELRLRDDGDFYFSQKGQDNFVNWRLLQSYDATSAQASQCFSNGSTDLDASPDVSVPEADLAWGCTSYSGVIDRYQDNSNAARPVGVYAMGIALRALGSASTSELLSTTFEGRDVWSVATPTVDNYRNNGPQTATLLVDKETGFPLRVTVTSGPTVTQQFTLHNLQLNDELSDDDLMVRPPARSQQNEAVSYGDYQSVTIAQARAANPMLVEPTSLPSGYRLATVQSGPVTALTYRRGLESFTVLLAEGQQSDPNGSEYDTRRADGEVVLTSGAFGGRTASVSIGDSATFVWANSPTATFAIAGDITRETAIDLANSLSPLP